jgi:hypothetical protein
MIEQRHEFSCGKKNNQAAYTCVRVSVLNSYLTTEILGAT